MKKIIGIAGILLIIGSFFSVCYAEETKTPPPLVRMETSHGPIVIELNPSAAPKTVDNFLTYVRDGFYDKTIFHRVIKGFMIQGGGFTKEMYQKNTRAPIKNEADNGLKNKRGTIAMARTYDADSATSQFFINLVDNDFLDHKEKTGRGWGYCVFGNVVDGIKVIDVIADQSTTVKGMYKDVPAIPVIIDKVSIIEDTPIKKTTEK